MSVVDSEIAPPSFCIPPGELFAYMANSDRNRIYGLCWLFRIDYVNAGIGYCLTGGCVCIKDKPEFASDFAESPCCSL
jgi:hypothetical protein